jgi:hypothetical protein
MAKHNPYLPGAPWHSTFKSAKALNDKRFLSTPRPLQGGDEGQHGEIEVPTTA